MINLCILLIYILNSFICYFCSNKLNKYTIFILSFVSTVICMYLAMYNFHLTLVEDISKNYTVEIFYFLADSIPGATISLNHNFISSIMVFVVCIVTFVVVNFSQYYLEDDNFLYKFTSFLYLFSFFMIILVCSSNLITMFIGWEGVGICSYLLISFWGTRTPSVNSGAKAIFINKVGDFFFMIVIMLCIRNLNSVDFDTVNCYYGLEEYSCNLIVLCSFICVCSKSAQLGLHSWLPDAMEGPTPISALIHAATMVTAGVFFIIRMNGIFIGGKYLILILSIGVLTCSLFSITGFFQSDLKKVIAYSTCSQLGFMVITFYLGQYTLSLFHLFNHAFFKAMLFLSAGSIIHIINDEQDLRKFCKFRRTAPITCAFINIGSISLMGVLFLSGFYSKDLIIETLESDSSFLVFYVLVLVSCAFTSMYSFNLIYCGLYNFNNSSTIQNKMVEESNLKLLSPLFILYLLSIIGGNYFLNKFYIYEHPIIEGKSKTKVFLVVSLGAYIPIFMNYYLRNSKILHFCQVIWYKLFPMSRYVNNRSLLKNIFFNKLNLDKILYLFYCKISNIAEIFYYRIERQILEIFGPHGIYKMILLIINKINKIQMKKINDIYIVFCFSLIWVIISVYLGT